MTNKKLVLTTISSLAAILVLGSFAPSFAGADYHTEHLFEKSRGASASTGNWGQGYGFSFGQFSETPGHGPPTTGGLFYILNYSPFCFDLVPIEKEDFVWGYDLTYVTVNACGGNLIAAWSGNGSTETIKETETLGENCGEGQFSGQLQGKGQEAESILFYNGSPALSANHANIWKGSLKLSECGPTA